MRNESMYGGTYTMYYRVTPQLFPKPLKFIYKSYIIFLSVAYPYNLILINVFNI